ncbi:MAG: hypothetical protein JNM63_14515 [Spirochaetia bacterium]|nr:hypothetical protein [Spirochaetia bacterium]
MSSFEIIEDIGQIDFAADHKWLSTSYWSPGISLEKIKKGAEHSALVVSARVFKLWKTRHRPGHGEALP